MSATLVREKLARISARPVAEWSKRVEQEFPGDPGMRVQALLWLHSEAEGPESEGAPPSLGDAADERYELTLRLDTGTGASVWQAYDRRLGRNVAIKIFRDHSESEAIEQVIAEARAASDVVSEHVVRVLDVQYGDAHPYIVMELVSEYEAERDEVVLGKTAAETPARNVEEVARWVMHVARGVHEAHLRNVFHRDLKPRNVLITPNSRRARVADFGLAISGASPDATHPAITLLKRGPSGPVSVRGTPEYMAPEQARGLPLTLDARSSEDRAVLVAIDVWGLGAIAYELLTGRSPWLARRDLSAWEIAASSERPAALDRTRDGHRIPPRLRRVIERAMATDPKARYASAAAVANELQAFLGRFPTTLDRSRLLRVGLWCRRNPQLALFVVAAIGLSGLAAGTHATVMRLRTERADLNREVEAQQSERAKLHDSVEQARTDLETTRTKLAGEQQSLANLEASIAEERGSYQTLLEAKEKALQDATTSTRQIMQQLELSRRERRAAALTREALQDKVDELRKATEKAAKDLDRIWREREVARSERDAARLEQKAIARERDAALAERDAFEKRLNALRAELDRVAKTTRK